MPRPGPRRAIIAPLLVVALLAAWAGWAEWRFRADLLAGMPTISPEIAASATPREAARLLDAMSAAAASVSARAAGSPLGLIHLLGPLSPAVAARDRYAAAADSVLPRHIADAVADALATEGGSLPLYDVLEVEAILAGTEPWRPRYLSGWLADRGGTDPALAALAPHAAALTGPPPTMPAQDAELLVQARAIAAEGDPSDFAFLELRRSDVATALPPWSAAGIPELGTVLVRRSGQAIDAGIPGLFTAAGWRAAAGGEAAAAIARAAAQAGRLVGRPVEAAPEAAVLDTLQDRTLDAWTTYLGDLRVRPFDDQPTAMLTTGLLARRSSPLEALFREVWREAGGEDRGRSHANQLRIAATFGPMIPYVEQGRLADISRLFATLNVALAERSSDAEVRGQRLLDVQARAASIAALDQAPLLVVQIVEDVLAQTAVEGRGSRPRAAVAWRQQLAGDCRNAIAGAYPFATGPDSDLGAVADLLRPDGRLERFVASDLASLIQTDATPWRWRPEARLSGFQPESAAFFERAAAAGAALFPDRGVSLTLSALAQRGRATLTVGGVAAAVTTADAATTLAWPGPAPDDGLRIALAREAATDTAAWPGPWGLLHFLDGLPLRSRDDGRRFLLDVRLPNTRVYMELAFPTPVNPATVQQLLRGLACPDDL